MAKAKKINNKRVNKTKEEVANSLLQKQLQERVDRFGEMFEQFKSDAAQETGLTIGAQIDVGPMGVKPKLVILELPKNENQQQNTAKKQ